MGKKKFIDKKKAATFRLVFKDSSEQAYGDIDGDGNGHDRIFMRVGGGHGHVAGFDDDESEGSIFEDAEEEEGGEGRGKDRSLRVPSKSSSSATTVARQEIIELGFPDDGYNYLQHLREIGPSGRTGSFVPNNNLRLDLLRPDVKVFIYCTSCLSILHMLPSHTVIPTHCTTLIFTFGMFSDTGFHIVDYDLSLSVFRKQTSPYLAS